MPESPRPTAVFDIFGTCFSLEKPRQALARLGAPEPASELWFAQSLRDSFAFSHSGGYAPLREMLKAELARTVAQLGLRASDDDLTAVLGTLPNWIPGRTSPMRCGYSAKPAGSSR